MRKGTIVRYFIVKYRDVGNGHLFPYPVDGGCINYYRRPTAHRRLQELQAQDFANSALYGLARATFPADYSGSKYRVIEK